MTQDEILRMEGALQSDMPPLSLYTYALELSASGLGRQAIYAIFMEMFERLGEEGRETDQGHVELILDSLTHFMSPKKPLYLNLPE